MELREHQKICINNISYHFELNDRGLVKMFCGSGKSFIIYHELLEFGKNISVVVVPSINLITQFNNDYLFDKNKIMYNKNKFKKKFKLMSICSKNELNEEISKKISFTTEPNEIEIFLENKIDKIMLITYQSLVTLIRII